MMRGDTQGTVEKAVRAELRALHCSVTADGSAAMAVSLAQHMDSTPGAVAAAAAATQLRLLMDDLRRAAAGKKPEKDVIGDLQRDELAGRRAAAAR
jgi:hypothetical protein